METLLPFQSESARWLSKQKTFGLLSLDCGLGKTAVAISASDLIRRKRVLVICPAVAVPNWFREFERFSDRQKDRQLEVFSYASLHKIPSNFEPDLLILDESHFLKSIEAARTQAILGKTGLLRRVMPPPVTWALSGTPCPNHAAELWPLLYTFGVTTLRYDAFVQRYCDSYLFQGHKRAITGTKAHMIPELKKLLEPVMLRKKVDEVLSLPPIVWSDIIVPAGPVDLEKGVTFPPYVFPHDRRSELFAKLEREATFLKTYMETVFLKKYATVDLEDLVEERIAGLSSIAHSISTLRMWVGLQKVDAIGELIYDELKANAYEKIVIFAIHRDVIMELFEKLKRYGAVTVFGGTPPEKRQKHIDKFQKDPKCRVFIGNIHSAGTAITLTAANQVFFAEQSWVPGDNYQAAARCRRYGQTKKVFVRIASLADSLDDKINATLKRKQAQLSTIYGDAALPQDIADKLESNALQDLF